MTCSLRDLVLSCVGGGGGTNSSSLGNCLGFEDDCNMRPCERGEYQVASHEIHVKLPMKAKQKLD